MSTDVTEVKNEGTKIILLQGGQYTVAKTVVYDAEISDLLFTQLADTPNTYEEAAGKTVTVNKDGNGLEFSKTYSTFLSLNDTPVKYDGHSGSIVAVKQDGTGLTFLNYSLKDLNIEYFTQLADVPNTYSGNANSLLVVNQDESGIDFSSLDNVLPDQNVTPGTYDYPHIVVDIKGRIVAIEEGEPFSFPDFENGAVLVGDGSDTPVTLPKGEAGQVLTTLSGSANASWQYVTSLYNPDGSLAVYVNKEEGATQNPLKVIRSADALTLSPASSTLFALESNGSGSFQTRTNFSIGANGSPGNFLTTIDLNQNGEIIITGESKVEIVSNRDAINLLSSKGIYSNAPLFFTSNALITSDGSLTFNPTFGKLTVSQFIDPATYAGRITADNDLTTKKYVDVAIQQAQSKDTAFTKSESKVLLTQEQFTNFKIGKSYVDSVTFWCTEGNNCNEECTLQVSDSLGNLFIDGSTVPFITTEPVKLFIGKDMSDMDENYTIQLKLLNYTYGEVIAFISYYTIKDLD